MQYVGEDDAAQNDDDEPSGAHNIAHKRKQGRMMTNLPVHKTLHTRRNRDVALCVTAIKKRSLAPHARNANPLLTRII